MDVAKYLIKNCADLEVTNRWENTAVLDAMENDYSEAVECLIDAGTHVSKWFFFAGKGGSGMMESMTNELSCAIQGEIAKALFSFPDSPFSELDYKKDGFIHLFTQTVAQYVIVSGLTEDSYSEWEPFLACLNDMQDRKRQRHFSRAIQDEISRALFSISGSPFFGLDDKKGSFGYHFIRTVAQYVIALDLVGLPDSEPKEDN
jgi:hypothetical protein